MKSSLVLTSLLLSLKLSLSSDDKPEMNVSDDPFKMIGSEVERFTNLFEEYLIQQSHAAKKIRVAEPTRKGKEKKGSDDECPKKESRTIIIGDIPKLDQSGVLDLSKGKEPANKDKKITFQIRDSKIYIVNQPSESKKDDEPTHKKDSRRRSRSAVRMGAHRKRHTDDSSSSDDGIPRKTKREANPFKIEEKVLPPCEGSEDADESDEEIIELTRNLSKATLEEEKMGARRKVRSNSEDRYDKERVEEIEDGIVFVEEKKHGDQTVLRKRNTTETKPV